MGIQYYTAKPFHYPVRRCDLVFGPFPTFDQAAAHATFFQEVVVRVTVENCWEWYSFRGEWKTMSY
jgi:hypothetical protein